MTTYGVSWYVEVEAADEKEAIAKARKFLAPKCRNDWDPLSVDEMED